MSYFAKAVHTDGTAWVSRDGALTHIVDSFYGVVSFWTNINTLTMGETDIFCSQPGNNLDVFNQVQNQGGEIFLQDASSPINVIGTTFGAGNTDAYNGAWHHTLIAWNTDFIAGSRLLAVLVDGLPASNPPIPTDVGVAYKAALAAETNWGIMGGGTGDNVAGDYADVQFYQGLNIIQSNGSILASDLANFIDSSGKPVDPAIAVAAYGTPIILLSGDITTFAANNGSGGSFAVNGTLTNATTSPSAFIITTNQQIPVTVNFDDDHGNAAVVDGIPIWTVSDATILSIVANVDGMGAIISAVADGTASVSVTANADMVASGTPVPVIGTLTIQVVSGVVSTKNSLVIVPKPVNP